MIMNEVVLAKVLSEWQLRSESASKMITCWPVAYEACRLARVPVPVGFRAAQHAQRHKRSVTTRRLLQILTQSL